jgi:hypothetical protein
MKRRLKVSAPRPENIAGETLMTCKDCMQEISTNKMCDKPIQSAIDILKHMG